MLTESSDERTTSRRVDGVKVVIEP